VQDDAAVVVGAGHNGLVAAILAAQAGWPVTVLERSDHPGGASVGAAVFDGHPVRLSQYSYLVSLFPEELVDRLGIELALAPRTVASYTPVWRGGMARGLLVQRDPGPRTRDSFRDLTGSDAEFAAWQQFYGELRNMAAAVAPVLMGPLRTRSEVRAAVVAAAGEAIWHDVVEAPIGEAITRRFADDAVRGVIATDALIGTHASLFDPSLLANRCFLYHLIGRGSGEWLVPVGGMGSLADALVARARALGVQIRCGTEVTAVQEDDGGVTVQCAGGDGAAVLRAGALLAAVAPATVDGWLGRATPPPEGAQLKVNMLLSRLPRLASGDDPEVVFAGTAHLAEGFDELERAYRDSSAGRLPDPLPCEIYCHSLADPSIMTGGPGHTLTLFGLHTPASLFRADTQSARDAARDAALAGALESLQHHLAEPLRDCLAVDAHGIPCVQAASPLDVEASVGMPGGHIFHGDLAWPWRTDDEPADTAARRYGVEVVGCRRILLAGAGTRRGGGVSGLGGLAAVEALLAGAARGDATVTHSLA